MFEISHFCSYCFPLCLGCSHLFQIRHHTFRLRSFPFFSSFNSIPVLGFLPICIILCVYLRMSGYRSITDTTVMRVWSVIMSNTEKCRGTSPDGVYLPAPRCQAPVRTIIFPANQSDGFTHSRNSAMFDFRVHVPGRSPTYGKFNCNSPDSEGTVQGEATARCGMLL